MRGPPSLRVRSRPSNSRTDYGPEDMESYATKAAGFDSSGTEPS